MAYVGALIIDAVVDAATVVKISGNTHLEEVYWLIALEALIVAAPAGAQRGINLCQSLLRARLGQRVNVMILEKALTLEIHRYTLSQRTRPPGRTAC